MRSLGLLTAVTLLIALFVPAANAGVDESWVRLDILFDVEQLPERDRAELNDRLRAIEEARASDLPLFRSFDARSALRETIEILEANGVDLGPSAIVNFDNVEAWVSSADKRRLRELAFISRLRTPIPPVPAGVFDSEGIALTLANQAHLAGYTGAGIAVAIIDRDYEILDTVIADAGDELYAIPTTDMFLQQSSGSSNFNNISVNAQGDREHGTASAEVIYEMAPGATIKLYSVKSTVGIEYAIRHAADQGFDIIHVPLTHIETMSDPVGTGSGGTNRFTDDIDYAVGLGSVVVVAAGNEAKRHIQGEYLPCAECEDTHPDYICNDANDNSDYHKFQDAFDELALNALIFDDDHYDAESFDLTCWSAIETGFDPTKFKFRLHKYDEGSEHGEPLCPGDSGASPISGTETNLGGFFIKGVNLFDGDFDEQYHYISLRYTDHPTVLPQWPDFRIACGTGVDELLFLTTPGSLSDLAVVESAITVSEIDAFFADEVTETSSQGPAASGPLKPDVGGPGIVENFTVTEFDFISDWTFNGTSAASAHVAGVAAIVQHFRVANGLPMFTPAEMKQALKADAIDIEDPGPDAKVGAGLLQVPGIVFGPVDPCGNGVVDAGEACDDGNTADGDCCSATCDAIAPSGTVCRASQGTCDPEETCDGSSGVCPLDSKSTSECRAAGGVCDLAESCDGISNECPVDLKSTGTCRASTDACDAEEVCDGASDTCPADLLEPAGTECRATSGACDPAESCTGASASCPTDVMVPDGDGDGACDDADVCPDDADPGQEDGDGDGLGDACDACNGGVSLYKPLLKVSKFTTGPGDDRFKMKGTLPFFETPAFDPAVDGVGIHVYDADRKKILEAQVPGGAYDKVSRTGWKSTPTGSRHVFKSPTLVGGLVNKVTIATTKFGSNVLKVIVSGAKGGFASGPLALPLVATVDLTPSDDASGACGDADFAGPAPLPICKFSNNGATLTCR